jgi:hypothetical protein
LPPCPNTKTSVFPAAVPDDKVAVPDVVMVVPVLDWTIE